MNGNAKAATFIGLGEIMSDLNDRGHNHVWRTSGYQPDEESTRLSKGAEMKLLLTREEINARELEGVKNARNLSELTAAMAWAQMHREHPWRGFFMDIVGELAMIGASVTALRMR